LYRFDPLGTGHWFAHSTHYGGTTVDVTKLLEADHRKVEDLFDQIEKAQGDARQPLIELVTSLKAHMELEEQVLYPMMEPVTGKEAVVEANTEHELGRKGLADVEALSPDEPGFGAALDATKAGIAHHVKEEEEEVFPKLRKDAELLERIQENFLRVRTELGLPTDSRALASASNKQELLASAKAVGVERAGSMTKEQLADAVAADLGLD
jgi:hemerythrin superfamily protein